MKSQLSRNDTDTVPRVSASTPDPAKGRPTGPSPQAAIPVLLFVVVNRVAGLRFAVVAATIWSVKLLIDRRRSGTPLGVFMPILTLAVLVRGAIGAITGNETLYFGLGIATKYAVVVVLLGSLLVARPLAAYVAPHILELTEQITSHRRFRTAMVLVTAIVALYYLVSATFDVWLFRRSSVEGFVIWRFLANWPLSAIALAAIIGITHMQFRQIPGFSSLPTLFEQRMAQYWPDAPTKPRDQRE